MKYILREDQGVTKTIECEECDVHTYANEWAHEGDYGDVKSTIWVDTQIIYDGDIIAVHTTAIDPDEPDCTEDEHDFRQSYELFGGCKENPGVWGHGGGVIIHEACYHCGCKRIHNTWAQRMDTGEQGLESITYEDKAFSCEELDSAFDRDNSDELCA